jgi:hypothetical protein
MFLAQAYLRALYSDSMFLSASVYLHINLMPLAVTTTFFTR